MRIKDTYKTFNLVSHNELCCKLNFYLIYLNNFLKNIFTLGLVKTNEDRGVGNTWKNTILSPQRAKRN